MSMDSPESTSKDIPADLPSEPLLIRKATPDDAPFLARVLLFSSRSELPRGPWDLLLDQPEPQVLEFLEKVCVSSVLSWAHYTCFLIGSRHGVPVSGVAGYDPSCAGGERIAYAAGDAMTQLGWPGDEIARSGERLVPLNYCASPEPSDVWIVESVATMPEFRRTGCIGPVIQAQLDRGFQLGFKAAQITLRIDYEPAMRSYLRAGFRVVEERRHPEFQKAFGCPGLIRMTRPLP